ncbi:MAG: PaaI family thioesterase [Candidatus Hydrogenedentales bacterium]
MTPEAPDLPRKGRSPYINLLGIRFVAVEPGLCRCEIEADAERHLNMQGYLHGGVCFSLMDTAMGASLHPLLGEGEGAVTLEIQINYLRSVTEGLLECEARVVRRGKRVAFFEADVYCGGELIAHGTGSYAIVEKRTS